MDIRHFSFIGSYIKRIEKNILELGFQKGLRREIEKSNSKFLVLGRDEIKEILTKAPVVIVFNHQYEIETIACLTALPDREDIFLVATHFLKGLLPAIDKHLISIYVRQRKITWRKFSAFILENFISKEKITSEDKHRKNIKSINEAAEKVKQGGLVMITPNPHNKKWQTGIGWLINNIGPTQQAYYVKMYVANSSFLDYLRLVPVFGWILPTVKVYFSQPIKLNKIWQQDGKKLTFELEREYNDWVKGLNK
ncbi:hypothetical protein L6279_00765 [Candidatus Parcubacteria bacterium]|nr:hypothetical protein [Patescibacteria group bacterium]MCG2688622.1 hypothetical protein [Candidatus Parcubacteria bacterium]MCG2692627.1 hypothetical protein [Candidatus Parcubacteria bacterium]